MESVSQVSLLKDRARTPLQTSGEPWLFTAATVTFLSALKIQSQRDEGRRTSRPSGYTGLGGAF